MTLAKTSVESTVELLDEVKGGDGDAMNRLCARYLPTLRSWARGRLPGYARDLRDTEDLVQESVFQAIRHLDRFEPRGRGALQAYLRQAVINRIRDEVRRVGRRGAVDELTTDRPDEGASPLEQVMSRQAIGRYRGALARLRPEEQALVTARIEQGFSYAEVAQAFGKPTPDAARMAVNRALTRLAEVLTA
ncbi:MAG: sigma-70 family RNA polymerase sigma factor [Vicinamibacterales bacterium]